MPMEIEEITKLFDFILENKSLLEEGIFNIDTLVQLRAIMRDKQENDFLLNANQKQSLIDYFGKSNLYFTEDTPKIFLENEECIKKAVERSWNNVNFIKNITTNIEKFIMEQCKKKRYILNINSPRSLKKNYEVAFNSVSLDPFSADFIWWSAIKEEERANLVDEVLKNGYVLSINSCGYLCENKKVVLASIQKDITNIQYADNDMKDDPDIFKYLIAKKMVFKEYEIKERNLYCLLDSEIMMYCMEQRGLFHNENKQFRSRFVKLYHDALSTYPTVKSFQYIFAMIAEEKWKKFRAENKEDYENIFGKICAKLRYFDDYRQAMRCLNFKDNMRLKLEEKFNDLTKAMKDYCETYHSNEKNKLEKLESSQNIIAKLSALYVAKCKEDYKKEQMDEYIEWMKMNYFKLRIDHPDIKPKVIQQKKKENFRKLYINHNEEVIKFADGLIQKYKDALEESTLQIIISGFIYKKQSKLKDIIGTPYGYEEFERYEKALKLVHRLNSHYISYNDQELKNYRDIVVFDKENREYKYWGTTFEKEQLKAFAEYRKKEKIFQKIKKEIISKINELEINDNEIDLDTIKKLSTELPFNDEYFEFNAKDILKVFHFNDLYNVCFYIGQKFPVDPFLSDEVYNNIYNSIVKNRLIWALLLINRDYDESLEEYGISKMNVKKLIENMNGITELSKELHFDLKNLNEVLFLNKIIEHASDYSVAILGKEVIKKLYENQDYTNNPAEDIILMATELVCQMAKRRKSTVPYIKGQQMNYKYSMYDTQDETILLTGINTDACFKIDGNDNDFLHYCALDKNGFVIKITDTSDNFIGRASGFRNGNCVFINQLRTIYDEGEKGYRGYDETEREDIIKIFRHACRDIVWTSQNNPKETKKIDHVFVTKSYILKQINSNVSNAVTKKIGNKPMDYKSEDWKEFAETTKNLDESSYQNYFTTDYGKYPLICVASSKIRSELEPEDLKFENVEALYERRRSKVIVTNQKDSVIKRLNKINGISAYFKNSEFEAVKIPEDSTIFTGDNWYIIFYDGKIISSCILDFDEKAVAEANTVKEVVKQYTLKKQYLDRLEISELLEFQQNEAITLKRFLV